MSPKKSFDQTFLKFAAKHFAQAFLKLDTWFESTRGLITKRKHSFFFERKVLDKKK